MKLTPKRKAFCKEFVSNGRNATQAAIGAGYSEKTAGQAGSRLLKNVDVKSYIAELEAKEDEIRVWTKEKLVEEYVENLKLARQTGQVAGANGAIAGISKLEGLDVQKIESLHEFKPSEAQEAILERFKNRVKEEK